MQKNNKIILVLSISFFLIVSLLFIFIIREKAAQSSVSLAQVEQAGNNDNTELELILTDIRNLLGVDFSETSPADFEWRYRDNEDLRSVNVAGVSISFQGSLSAMMAIKNYFQEKGFILDASNNIKGAGSGLAGHYKDGIACLAAFSSGSGELLPVDTAESDLSYSIEIHCGHLSEQDSLRIVSLKENEEQASEEYEAVSIVRSYLEKLPDYIDKQGGEISISSIKKLDCPGCWQIETGFEIADPDNLESRISLQGFVYLDDWLTATSTIEFPIKSLESIEICEEIGGKAASSTPEFTCQENEILLGKIISKENPQVCCQKTKVKSL